MSSKKPYGSQKTTTKEGKQKYMTPYMREYRRRQKSKLEETLKKALSAAKPGPLKFGKMLERIEASPNQLETLEKERDSLNRYHKTLLKELEKNMETTQKLDNSPMNLPTNIENLVAKFRIEKDLALTQQSITYVFSELEKLREETRNKIMEKLNNV